MSGPVRAGVHREEASPLRLALGLGAIYLIWGSTYLAIRFAIVTLPPLFMAGIRFLVAGSVLYAWLRARGAPSPEPRRWPTAILSGVLMVALANGGVAWAERTVPSGIAALTVATTPLWLVVLAWLHPKEESPTRGEWLGVVAGLAGVALLVAPGDDVLGSGVDPVGFGALLLASLAWAAGSIHNRFAELPRPQLLGTSMTMISGGALLVVVAAAGGELQGFDPRSVTTTSLLALAYLIVLGSIVAFSVYMWLIRSARPAVVGTYAYVNPLVALVLGWLVAAEPLTPRALLAASVILGSVVVVNRSSWRRKRRGKMEAGTVRAGSGTAARGTCTPPPDVSGPGLAKQDDDVGATAPAKK